MSQEELEEASGSIADESEGGTRGHPARDSTAQSPRLGVGIAGNPVVGVLAAGATGAGDGAWRSVDDRVGAELGRGEADVAGGTSSTRTRTARTRTTRAARTSRRRPRIGGGRTTVTIYPRRGNRATEWEEVHTLKHPDFGDRGRRQMRLGAVLESPSADSVDGPRFARMVEPK